MIFNSMVYFLLTFRQKGAALLEITTEKKFSRILSVSERFFVQYWRFRLLGL